MAKVPFVSQIAGLLMLIPERWRRPIAILFLVVALIGGVMFAANQTRDFFNDEGACDVTLFGTQANITGRPASVTLKALGLGVESITPTPADKRRFFSYAEVKIPNGKAVSIQEPHGQYNIKIRAKNPKRVVLKAVVDCND